jgi:SAM-dependent methyltransferase
MERPSYHHLSDVYDELFPLDPEALSLVLASLGTRPPTVVDAGCGTGLLVRALADHGVRAHGFDLDPDLLERASLRSGGNATFQPGDLRTFQLPFPAHSVGLICCLGNTLPHLTTTAQVAQFLTRAAEALVPRGTLLLQILDYGYLKREKLWELPAKTVGPWTFSRSYTVQSSGLWTFHTRLTSPGVVREAAFDLRPWEAPDLQVLLGAGGFRVEGVWGGFDLREPGRSLPLVLRAHLL